nr:ATP-binding protein [Ramlibacter aurantiacus]
MREDSRLLKAITLNASVALFVMDPHQQCVFMNPAAEALTGYTFAEVQGRPLHDVIHHTHPDGRPYPLHECPIDRAFPERHRMQGDEVFVHKQGHFYDVAFTASPILDDDGRPIGTVIEVRDITERKRQAALVAAEAELLELLNETSSQIAAELELDKLLQRVTDAATRLTGAQFGAFFYNGQDDQGEAMVLYTLSGAPRSAFESFGHPRATPLFAPTFHGEPVVRIEDVRADPRYGKWGPHFGMPPGHLPVRSYLAVSVHSRRGDTIGGLFFGHSAPRIFTERSERLALGIAAQAATAIDNARLYAEAQRVARQRDVLLTSERAARSEAESASRLKDQFLATLSHELRTPLSAMLGWLHILRTKGVEDPAVLERGLNVIERSARTQHQLIEDLLDMSRISTGKLHLEPAVMDLREVLDAALELIEPAAAEKRLVLSLDHDGAAEPVLGDAARLKQVFWNLLSNAVKFTPDGGRIHVRVRRLPQAVQVAIEDTGVGIRPEFLPHLFERFRQADGTTSRRYGGLGLGLALVHKLVHLHGGSVEARSPGEGQGATFTVSLPLASHAADDRPERDERVAEASPLAARVLLVEDDPGTREFLERFLADAGAQVQAAPDAAAAMACITGQGPFDLVISDIGMAGLDGYGLVRWLRRQSSHAADIPAIALTAFVRSEDVDAARRAGFDEHVSKPIDPQLLLRTAMALLARRASART